MSVDKLVKFLEKNLFVTLQEAHKLGIIPMTLSRMVNSGAIYRLQTGVYAQEIDWLTDSIRKYTVACTLYPEAIICGVSALTHYDLTDEEERKTWIAIPAPQNIHNPRYRVIRPTGLAYKLGVEKHVFGRRVVRIYDCEKSVVDAFKYLTEEAAYKALKRYLNRKDKNIRKLCRYADNLKKPLEDKVRFFLSDE